MNKGALNSKLKPTVDVFMTVALLFLMSYELIGATAHEIVGVVMFVLFAVHHALNMNWAKHLTHGRQTAVRIYRNIIVLLVLVSFVGSIVSGVIISRELFAFLNIKASWRINRLHMLSAYWGFVFMSLHLGTHYNVILSVIKKNKRLSNTVKTALKIIFAGAFAYGVFAFFKRDIAGYLFLKNQFFILGDDEILALYLFDYAMIMFSFSVFGYFAFSKIAALSKRKRGVRRS